MSPTLQPIVIQPSEKQVLNIMGTRQMQLLTSAQTAGTINIVEQIDEPGAGIPMHVHTLEDEIFHVIDGEIEVVAGGERHVLGAGATAYGPRGIPHSWKALRKSHILITIVPGGMDRMFHELAALPPGTRMGTVMEICGRYGITFL